jgi:UDP-2,3-diacylglucosamine pyrophosphatase LpxH
MRIIALGDTHGRDTWKKIIAKENFDKIVFIGDYLDSRDGISGETQLQNFIDILQYKRENIDKVVLLFGNHDFHYLPTSREPYSQYQHMFRDQFQNVLVEAIDERLLQMCYSHGNFLFSHAGFTKTWCKTKMGNPNPSGDSFVEGVNTLFLTDPNSFEFTPGESFSWTGDDITQTPIWVRPYSLVKDKIDRYLQIVGHTTVERIEVGHEIVPIDAIGSGEYLIIEDEKLYPGKIQDHFSE